MNQCEQFPAHGGQLRQIAEHFGIPKLELLDFSANINPAGPPPAVFSALRDSLNDPSTLIDYPDLEQLELKQSIARSTSVVVENTVVSNGFVPLLEAVLHALKIQRCLLPIPAFLEYRKTFKRAGVEVIAHTLTTESHFSYDPERMLAGAHDAILLANPQNPSGICHDLRFMRNLIGRALKEQIFILLDEAFIDYIPEHSVATAVDDFPNLVVFRSVTKFHGIPGLRVAYAVANAAISSTIHQSLPPWPITTLAARAVSAALEDSAYAVRSRYENTEHRTELQGKLKALGLRVYPSAANFLLFQTPFAVNPTDFWQRLILDHGVVLRACTNYECLPPGHFRTAVRTQTDNNRLVSAIAAQLGGSLPITVL
jgi:threonine-phosphate decarboxylase